MKSPNSRQARPDLELTRLESVFKELRRRQMSWCQVLVLLALARAGRALHVWEITEQTREHRQTVQKAIDIMADVEVRVERPSGNQTFVHLNEAGMQVLLEIINKK